MLDLLNQIQESHKQLIKAIDEKQKELKLSADPWSKSSTTVEQMRRKQAVILSKLEQFRKLIIEQEATVKMCS